MKRIGTHLYGWLFVRHVDFISLLQLLYMNAAESFSSDSAETENYWLNRTEMSEPIVNLLSNTDEAMRATIKNELLAHCNSKLINERLIMNYSSLVISAEK